VLAAGRSIAWTTAGSPPEKATNVGVPRSPGVVSTSAPKARLRGEPSRTALADAVREPVHLGVPMADASVMRIWPLETTNDRATASGAIADATPSQERFVEVSEESPERGATEGLTPGGFAGLPTVTDGALTANVNRQTGSGSTATRPAALQAGATSGVRDRVRVAASEISDRRVLARGIDAAVDLGDAGRILVRAEKPAGNVEITLDADVAHTARALAEHARDLSVELRTDAGEARVIVNGPSTHTSVSSNDSPQGRAGSGSGSGSGASAGASSGGGESASRHDRGEQQRPHARDGVASVASGGSHGRPSGSRRARFVL